MVARIFTHRASADQIGLQMSMPAGAAHHSPRYVDTSKTHSRVLFFVLRRNLIW